MVIIKVSASLRRYLTQASRDAGVRPFRPSTSCRQPCGSAARVATRRTDLCSGRHRRRALAVEVDATPDDGPGDTGGRRTAARHGARRSRLALQPRRPAGCRTRRRRTTRPVASSPTTLFEFSPSRSQGSLSSSVRSFVPQCAESVVVHRRGAGASIKVRPRQRAGPRGCRRGARGLVRRPAGPGP